MQQINVNVSGGGKLTSEEIDALYNAMKDGLMADGSSLVGQCTSDACYEDAATALHERFPQFSIEALKYFVRFKDPEVLRVLIANGVGDANGITMKQLEGLTDINNWFKGNDEIESFEEFSKTGVKSLGHYAFGDCVNLRKIDVSNLTIINKGGVWNANGIFNNTSIEILSFNKVKEIRCSSRGNAYNLLGSMPRLKALFFPSAEIQTNYNNDGDYDGVIVYNNELDYFRIFDYGVNCKTFTNCIVASSYTNGKCFKNGYTIIRTKEQPTIARPLFVSPDAIKGIFVPSHLISFYETNDAMSKHIGAIFSIGGTEWQSTMQALAEEEGYTKPDSIGWDYEYIDYLIYGCEPPTE